MDGRRCPAVLAVFLRAVNVGGHNVFKPAALAKSLARLDVKNVGAAGTFAVRGSSDAAAVERAFRKHLPVSCEIFVRPASEILDIVAQPTGLAADERPFVSILGAAPSDEVALPVESKGVRLASVQGTYALCAVLPTAEPGADVNGLVEKTLSVSATTRGRPTLEKLAEHLK